MTIFLTTFYVSIGVYTLCSLIFYWISDLNFAIYATKLRKTLYFLFFVGVGSGVLLGYIDMNKWQSIVQYVAIVIVIDIAVFETPSITKFASTEFKHNEVITKTISANEKSFKSIKNKQETFLSVVQDVENYFNARSTVTITNFSDYERELVEYLNCYLNNYKLKVRIYEFLNSQVDTDVKNDLSVKIHQLCSTNTISIREGHLLKIRDQLFEAKMQEVKEVHIIPMFGKHYNYLIELSGKDMILTDTMNVSYMSNLFETMKG